MRVILAGFNVDRQSLKDKGENLTPETISAAYARISRSPKSVVRLRREAIEEVERARRSNRNIIFEMGHHSIAEHAVFNFDIIGISRRAVEELERFRLCSYTEKSQRYVRLRGDFFIPKELKGSDLLDEYLDIINQQNNFYKILFNKLREHNLKKNAKNKRDICNIENLAKQDARYILPLATQTQLGATINGRNLELMIRRFASHPLSEINELGRKFFILVKRIAPSIILFYKGNKYDKKTYPGIKNHTKKIVEEKDNLENKDVKLIDWTDDADNKILATLLFRVTHKNYDECLKVVKKLTNREKKELFKKSCQYMQFYDVVLREFEFAYLTYSLIVSAACFGQLKRHRIATITHQDYRPNLGITIPKSIEDVGEKSSFKKIVKETEMVYQKIERKFPGVGDYVLTNGHRKRVLLNVNLRELYHISRLREDATAQWEIRDKAHKMASLAKGVMPITTQLLGGKDRYSEVYQKLFTGIGS